MNEFYIGDVDASIVIRGVIPDDDFRIDERKHPTTLRGLPEYKTNFLIPTTTKSKQSTNV